jgi:hypothetical protein
VIAFCHSVSLCNLPRTVGRLKTNLLHGAGTGGNLFPDSKSPKFLYFLHQNPKDLAYWYSIQGSLHEF